MRKTYRKIGVMALLGLVLFTPLEVEAQPPRGGEQGLGVDLSLSAAHQFRAGINDSRFTVSRFRLKVDRDLMRSPKVIMNMGLSLGLSDYIFSGPAADPWSAPFETIRNVGGDLAFILPGEGKWVYFLAGNLDWSWESDAEAGEGLVYGVIASASHIFRPDRRLGFGMAIFEGIEERKVFPYAAVSWRLKENLTLTNPLSVGPAGPAGLELVYDAPGNWQIGTGAAYRSFRFRLDDEGVAPGGVGELTGIPAWVRASWQAGPRVDLGLYAGAILAGEATLEDSSGRKLESDHFDPAPIAAMTLELSF